MFERRSDITRFLTLAERASLHVASRELGLTRQALNYTIAIIERRAGAPLFERLTEPLPGVRLTPLGEVAARHARRILRVHEAGEEQFASIVAGREGRVRVAASAVFLHGLLPGAVVAFHEEFPGIEVELWPAGCDAQALLADGCIDLYCGIMGSDDLFPNLRCDALPDMTAGIAARRGHPLLDRMPTWEDLAGYPWIVFGTVPDDEGESLLDEIRRHAGRSVQRVVRCGPDGLHLLQAGNYLAVLPLEYLDRVPGGFLAPLRGGPGTRRIRAGILSRRSESSLPAGRLHGILCQAVAPAAGYEDRAIRFPLERVAAGLVTIGQDKLIRLTLELPYDLNRRVERCALMRDVPVTKKQWILAAMLMQLEMEERTRDGLPGTRSDEACGRVPSSHTAPIRDKQVKFSIRIPAGVLRRVERAIGRRAVRTSRQRWIMEAILGRLARGDPVAG